MRAALPRGVTANRVERTPDIRPRLETSGSGSSREWFHVEIYTLASSVKRLWFDVDRLLPMAKSTLPYKKIAFDDSDDPCSRRLSFLGHDPTRSIGRALTICGDSPVEAGHSAFYVAPKCLPGLSRTHVARNAARNDTVSIQSDISFFHLTEVFQVYYIPARFLFFIIYNSHFNLSLRLLTSL